MWPARSADKKESIYSIQPYISLCKHARRNYPSCSAKRCNCAFNYTSAMSRPCSALIKQFHNCLKSLKQSAYASGLRLTAHLINSDLDLFSDRFVNCVFKFTVQPSHETTDNLTLVSVLPSAKNLWNYYTVSAALSLSHFSSLVSTNQPVEK